MNINNEPVWLEFDKPVEGEVTKVHYIGTFRIKPFLTREEKSDVARLAGMYNRGIEDPNTRSFNLMIAFLKMHVIEAKCAWWTEKAGNDLYDESPCYELAGLVNKAQSIAVGNPV
jgi:hypothetical protein